MTIAHTGIAALIPHQGSMCLLDTIERWDEHRICCTAVSHRRPDNPLRDTTGLRTICAIEYGAQAIAVHAALTGPPGAGRPAAGFLVAARDVATTGSHIDGIPGRLTIIAETVLLNENGRIYDVTVTGDGRTILQGRLSVMSPAAQSDTPKHQPREAVG